MFEFGRNENIIFRLNYKGILGKWAIHTAYMILLSYLFDYKMGFPLSRMITNN